MTAGLAGIVLLVAAPAFAHGVSVVTVEAPSFLPGATVKVSGQFLDGDLAVPAGVVSVTLGTGGPLVGQSQLGASGNWTLSFALPAETALGTYVLQATVPAGAAILIAQTALVIGAAPAIETATPVAEPAPDPVSAVDEDSVIPSPIVEPASLPVLAPAKPAVRTQPRPQPAALRAAPHASPVAVTPVRTVSAPAPLALTKTLAPPAATRVPASDGRRVRTRPAPRAATTPSSTAADGPSALVRSGATKPAMRPLEVSHRRGWIVAAALSLLLLFGGAARSAVWRRRSPREPLDPIELELQQMLEDERVRQTLTCEPPNPAESFASVER